MDELLLINAQNDLYPIVLSKKVTHKSLWKFAISMKNVKITQNLVTTRKHWQMVFCVLHIQNEVFESLKGEIYVGSYFGIEE